MNIDEVLLTEKEINKLDKQFRKFPQKLHKEKNGLVRAWQDYLDYRHKAQCLKLLEWLEKAGLLRCEYPIKAGNRKCHRKTCRRCELVSKLKEG